LFSWNDAVTPLFGLCRKASSYSNLRASLENFFSIAVYPLKNQYIEKPNRQTCATRAAWRRMETASAPQHADPVAIRTIHAMAEGSGADAGPAVLCCNM